MSENPSEPEMTELESALRALAPAPSRLDRDRLMFRAGQASVRPSRLRRRARNVIAASLALVALGEGVLLARRPPPQIVKEVVVVREPAPAPVAPVVDQSVAEMPVSLPSESSLSPGHTAYERQVAQVMRDGLDGLPAFPTVASPDWVPRPATAGQMLQEELRRLRDPGDPS
jgi:hypothetical protein